MSLNETSRPWVVNPDGSPGLVWNPIGRIREKRANKPILKAKGERNSNSYKHILEVERLTEPYRLKIPSRILTSSKIDLFSPLNRDSWIGEILFCMGNNRKHEFIIVTGYARFLMRWLKFIPKENVWLGAKVSRQEDIEEVFWLRMVDAKVRFVLFESLQEPIRLDFLNLDWAVFDNSKVGSFSSVEHILPLVDQARTMKIPIFMDGNLSFQEKFQEFPRKIGRK
jgi:protein gp37